MGMPAPRTAAAELAPGEQRLTLHGVTWEQYETLRATLDHIAGLRMTYLEGVLELMSPSLDHEGIKKSLARLLEIYALERDVPLNGYGSTTFRKRAKERGLEPDECYCVGPIKEVPDIALEVVLSSGGIDKLEVYRGLDVPEVWFWEEGRLAVFQLAIDGYQPARRSRFLPDLDLEQLLAFVRPDDQTDAVRAYRDALRP
jgi:Uma2 family endonuclease